MEWFWKLAFLSVPAALAFLQRGLSPVLTATGSIFINLQLLSLTSHFNIHFYWNHYLCILLPWNPLLALFNVLASCLYLQYHSQLSLPYHFSFLKFSCSSDSTIFKTPFAHGSCVCFISAAVYAWQWILRTDLFISFETLKSPSMVTLPLPIRQHGAAIHRKLSEVHEGV